MRLSMSNQKWFTYSYEIFIRDKSARTQSKKVLTMVNLKSYFNTNTKKIIVWFNMILVRFFITENITLVPSNAS